MSGARRVEAVPVSDGRRVRWTLEQERQRSQAPVRIDWLRFTVPLDAVAPAEIAARTEPSDMSDFSQAQRAALIEARAAGSALDTAAEAAKLGAEALCSMLPQFVIGEVETKGMDYYTARCSVWHEGAHVGWVLSGGKSSAQAGTVHFNLFGEACLFVRHEEWGKVRDFIAGSSGWITRVDLAHDVFAGDDITRVRDAYSAGAFDVRGKRPSESLAGAWVSGHSRSFYVGKRESGKLLRAYEKGDQLFGHEAGDEWIRYEVEFRSSSRVVDLDTLTRPADFFAGAYPFCAALLDAANVQPQRIPTFRALVDKTAAAAAVRVARWVRDCAAPSVAALLAHAGEAVDALILDQSWRVPGRLRGFSPSQLAEAFAKVGGGLAPPSSRPLFGAV